MRRRLGKWVGAEADSDFCSERAAVGGSEIERWEQQGLKLDLQPVGRKRDEKTNKDDLKFGKRDFSQHKNIL